MEREPRHHLALNCQQSTFAVKQLPLHFSVFHGEKLMLRRALMTVPVSDEKGKKIRAINKRQNPNKRRVYEAKF